MKELSKKILFSISYTFGLLIFTLFFLLVTVQYKVINLSPVIPFINKILISKKIINQNMELSRTNIFFERENKKIKINSKLIINNPSFDNWTLDLVNYLSINLDLR